MRNETRLAFDEYLVQLAQINGVADATKHFSVAPTLEQRLIELIQNSSDFLAKINLIPVIEQQGQKVGVGVTRPIAGRVSTANNTRRNPTDPTDTADKGSYNCVKTNSDVALAYSKLDAWAHKPEFLTMIRDAVTKRQGLDRIMIGFNGTSAAAVTDIGANPMLQDVNIGWLQKIRANAASQHLAHGGLDNAHVYVSETGSADYVNLDALVYDAVELLDEWYRDGTDLVCIVGRTLVHDKYFSYINAAGDTPMQVEARDRILTSSKQIGGLPAARVPFFPPNALLITSYDNLSIYNQLGTRRRVVRDEPEYDRVSDYQSFNESYEVEDYGKSAFVENISLAAKPA